MSRTKVSFEVVFDKYGHAEYLPPRAEGELPDELLKEIAIALKKACNNRNIIADHNHKVSITVCDKFKLDEMLLLKVGNPSEGPNVAYYVFPNRRGSVVFDADRGHFCSLESQEIYYAMRDIGVVKQAPEYYEDLYKEALASCTIKPL